MLGLMHPGKSPTFCAACGLEWTQHVSPCAGNPNVYKPPLPTDKERIAALERLLREAQHYLNGGSPLWQRIEAALKGE